MAKIKSGSFLESQNKLLIEIVKSNDVIFNKEKRYTYDEATRGNLWQQISAKLAEKGFPLPDPKTRWKQLRDQFTRHDKSGNRKWIYFENMNFMLIHICHKDKPPAMIPQWHDTSNCNKNSSANSEIHCHSQGLGNEASNVKLCLQQPPVLVVSNAHSVANEGLPLEDVEMAKSSSYVDELAQVEPMFNVYQLNPPQDPYSQTTDTMQMSSSNPTLGSSLQDTNLAQTSVVPHISSSATLKTLTVDTTSPPDRATEQNFTCLGMNVMQSPIALLGQKPLSRSSSTIKKPLTLAVTLSSSVRATNSTNRVAEPSRVLTNVTIAKSSRGEKRAMAVPPSDAFAKKKRKEVGKSEATEDAIIKCSNDLRDMSSEFKDLLKLKKELVRQQLKEGRVEVEIPIKNPMVESGDGFFNLLQKEWLDLPIKSQDELFPEMLDVMEEFELE